MTLSPEEDALRRELAGALKTARKKARLLQRELAHKTGYSRSRIAGAEAGDCVSRQFCERCDAVLGTRLAERHTAIRALRTQRLLAALAEDTDDIHPDEPANGREMRGSAGIYAQSRPETIDVQVLARYIGGFWHIAIRLPDVEHSATDSRQHAARNERAVTAG